MAAVTNERDGTVREQRGKWEGARCNGIEFILCVARMATRFFFYRSLTPLRSAVAFATSLATIRLRSQGRSCAIFARSERSARFSSRGFSFPARSRFQIPSLSLSPDWHLTLSELAGSCRFLANPTPYRVTRLARRLLFRSDAIGSIDRSIDRSPCHLRRATKVRLRPLVVRSASIIERFLTNRVTL